MMLSKAREILKQRNVANWDTLSDGAVARLFGGRLPGAPTQTRHTGPKLERIEEQAFKTMPAVQQSVYLVLREAAMADDHAPSYERLSEVCGGSEKTILTILRRLEARGAITRIPSRIQNKPAVYRLPWIDKETRA